jgi:hypothetical protein
VIHCNQKADAVMQSNRIKPFDQINRQDSTSLFFPL